MKKKNKMSVKEFLENYEVRVETLGVPLASRTVTKTVTISWRKK